MTGKALLIGNSDGIGLAATRELLKQGWSITGISRSQSPIDDPSYEHIVAEVQDNRYIEELKSFLDNDEPVDLCIYCVGIGELLDLSHMENEVETFEVNLMGLIKTISQVIPLMVKRGKGHFIGISSLADILISPEAPSYHATKAGFSNYLEGLALALKPTGVFITNMRFGFIDTKMAKGDVKPFMMSVDRAIRHLLSCILNKPIRYTAPWAIIPLIRLRRLMLSLKL
jgi:short-subunit dehydrogenase